MTNMKSFSLKPPTPKTEEAFVAQATDVKEVKPWEASGVREDVIKSVNLWLPEPLLLKLKYVSEKTRISQQEILREALIPYLDDLLNKL